MFEKIKTYEIKLYAQNFYDPSKLMHFEQLKTVQLNNFRINDAQFNHKTILFFQECQRFPTST